MVSTAPPPRIVIDFEQGAAYGDSAASLRFFDQWRPAFADCREVWLFNGSGACMPRCFYYPLSAPDRFGIPRGQGPRMVVIDDSGDELWLSGVGCGESGAAADGAKTVLTAIFPDFVRTPDAALAELPSYDEIHYVEGHLVTSRPVTEPRPVVAPGKTFTRNGRLACRMEYDRPTTTAVDLRALWARATEPHGWLGRPVSLTLFDDRAHSETAGGEGCQLIAVGESGRELLLQFPEPDTYERLSPGAARVSYAGAFTEYEAVKTDIFRAVGVELDPPDDRPWRDRILLRYKVPPKVIHWP